MFVFQITEIRDFTTKLFIGNTFDWFEVTVAEFQTACHFKLDGRLRADYYDDDRKQKLLESNRQFIFWNEVKPLCYQIIKGRRTPLSFRVALNVSRQVPGLQNVLERAAASGSVSSLNIRFEFSNNKVIGATGVSMSSFSSDRTIEYLWDEAALAFLRSGEILVEKL